MNPLHKVFQLFVLAAFLFSLISCSLADQHTNASQLDDFADQIGIPIVDYLDIKNDFVGPTKENLFLEITNKTNDCIYFPYDFGVQIFAYVNSAWVEIPQSMKYPIREKIFISSKTGNKFEAIFPLLPDYSGIKVEDPQKIRIVLAGYLCQNGVPDEKLTGDYIELEIQQ